MDILAPEAWEQPELALEEDRLATGLSTPLAVPDAGDAGDAKTFDTSEWATPQWLFDRYHAIYRFTLDGAANSANAKCPKFCVTQKEALRLLAEHGSDVQSPDGALHLLDGRVALADGLAQNWAGETVFLNPPYSPKGAIPPWCEKARDEALRGATVVMLLLADTSTDWYHDLVAPHAEVEFLRRRVRHVHPITGEVSPGTPKMGSLIAVYRPGLAPAPIPMPHPDLASPIPMPPADLVERCRRWACHELPYITTPTARRDLLNLLRWIATLEVSP